VLPRFGARAAVVAGSPGGDFLLPSLAATGPQQKADRVVSTFVLDLLQDGETAEFLADAASALRPGGSSASRPCPGARGPVSSTVAAIWNLLHTISPVERRTLAFLVCDSIRGVCRALSAYFTVRKLHLRAAQRPLSSLTSLSRSLPLSFPTSMYRSLPST